MAGEDANVMHLHGKNNAQERSVGREALGERPR
jgi:hypothetical protein